MTPPTITTTAAPVSPRLLGFSELRFAPDWQMPRHEHAGFHEMIVLTGGRIEVATRGQTVRGSAGSALVYPRRVPHQEWAVGGAPVRMFCLAWRDGGGDGPDDAAPPGGVAWPLVRPDRQGRLLFLLRWMQDLYPARGDAERNTLDTLMQALLHEYLRADDPGGGGRDAPNDAIARVKRHVREHLAGPLRLDDLAGVACLSRYHFGHAFKTATGLSPMEFVRQTRVEAARTLLLTSDLPLSAIADLVGFRDEFHLSRVFRRLTGHSPRHVRQQNRAG